MKTELTRFNIKELNKILNSVNEMITIPIHNKFNLNRDELLKMKTQLETEIKNR